MFFRSANVGGHQKFKPSILARELEEFDVVSIGAAGTFVVRKNVSRAKLQIEILRRLPFQPELMICPSRDVIELARSNPFQSGAPVENARPFVSVMRKVPKAGPHLPIERPVGSNWEVTLIEIRGRFALSLRRSGPKGVYPNAVVEEHFGTSATTRSWNTIGAIIAVLVK